MTSENNGMVMPVAPYYGGGYGNGGMFGDGNGAWWLLILLIALGGWGNGFGGMGGNCGMYPWLMNGQMNGVNDVQRGFDQSAVINGITGVGNAVTNGFSNVQTALCNGFAGVANGFAQAEISANARQIADMQQNFAGQTATLQGFNGTQTGIADLKYTVAAENCNDRAALASGIRDVMENCNRNNQAVLDKLCALELDGVKNQLAQAQRENVGLQNQLNMANLAASQTAQTGNIRDAIIGELRSCPIPAQPVYGSQPIFTCGGQTAGCGCMGGGFAA